MLLTDDDHPLIIAQTRDGSPNNNKKNTNTKRFDSLLKIVGVTVVVLLGTS